MAVTRTTASEHRKDCATVRDSKQKIRPSNQFYSRFARHQVPLPESEAVKSSEVKPNEQGVCSKLENKTNNYILHMETLEFWKPGIPSPRDSR